MTALIGEAAEQDEAFWGADVWESDDDSFSEVEVEPDVFDSDFNDTEDDDNGSSDEEKEVTKAGKKERTGPNKYKEPGGPKVKKPVETAAATATATGAAASSDDKESKPKPVARKKMRRVDSQDSGFSGSGVREVRHSTKVKTEVAVRNQKRVADDAFRTKVKSRPPLKHQFTQKELLLDALTTENDNQKWLELQRLQDYERALGDKVAKPQNAERFIRYVSRRGAPNTVTFSHVDLMPAMLRGVEGDGEDEDDGGD